MAAPDFAPLFRAKVAPHLRGLCRVRGLLVALRLETFGEAQSEVMQVALQRGAGRLSPELFDQLETAVSRWLEEEAAEVQPAIEEVRRCTERAVEAWNRYLALLAGEKSG